MRNELNTMSRMLAEDAGVVETAERKMKRERRTFSDGMNMTAPMMMRVLAADAGADELCDFRNYANTVSGRETLSERLMGLVEDIRRERAARREMHACMLRAMTDVRSKQTV